MTAESSSRFKWLRRYGVVLLTLLLVISLLGSCIFLANSSSTLKPLPVYPGSIVLNQNVTLPPELLNFYCSGGIENFTGEKYQAFATVDKELMVQTFYKKEFVNSVTENNIAPRLLMLSGGITGDSDIACLSTDIGGGPLNIFSHKAPAYVIRLLQFDNPADYLMLTRLFPTTPSDHNVILVVQGYKIRTLG